LKKLITITLLAVHLFNIAGYNLLFHYFMNRSEARLIKQLDRNDYNDQDLVVLKMPLNLPYYNSSGTTERVDGEIEISGTHYNYVKRQVSNDTLYLYCIPNTAKTKLRNAQTDFSKGVSDTQPDTGKGTNSLLKKMKWGAEYNNDLLPITCAVSEKGTNQKTGFVLHVLIAPPSASPYQPPEQA
jgi:hypothetical protein